MTRLVVDASVMGPLLFEDEAASLIAALPQALADGDCVVPEHWRFEVTNQILVGARRGRVKPDEADIMLAAMAALPVEVDRDSIDQVWRKTYQLAVAHSLTIYDAAYLELALRLGLPLATFDKALINAANECGITAITA
jgi:predicted nucleic acid-binding protein